MKERYHAYSGGKDHPAEACTTISEQEQRIRILRKQGRCFNCFMKNHMLRDCRSGRRCSKCGEKHHIAVCRKKPEQKGDHNAAKDVKKDEKKEEEKVSTNLMLPSETTKYTISLQTASIWMRSCGNRLKARVLFDTGSQRTFISKNLACKLKCEKIEKEKLKISSFGNNEYVSNDFDLIVVGLESGEDVFQV